MNAHGLESRRTRWLPATADSYSASAILLVQEANLFQRGMPVALLARETGFSGKLAEELSDNRAFACDVSDADSVEGTYNGIRSELGETVVYNAGSGVWVRRRSTARGDSDMTLLGNRNAIANLAVKNLNAASLSTYERAWFIRTRGDQPGGQ